MLTRELLSWIPGTRTLKPDYSSCVAARRAATCRRPCRLISILSPTKRKVHRLLLGTALDFLCSKLDLPLGVLPALVRLTAGVANG